MSRKVFSGFLLPSLFFAFSSITALAESHVRIVRLSTVQGSVKVDRGSGQFEKAIANLPITEGMRLRTGADGRVEVEFEDGSTVRLAPETSLQFAKLSLSDAGTKISVVEVSKGTAYAESTGAKDADLTLQFGQDKVALTRGAHVRLGVDESGAALADFKGDLQAEAPSGTVDIKKNQTANFDFSGNGSFKLAKRIQEETEDDWDKQQGQYHQTYAAKNNNNYSPYSYGTADLSYYGNFFSAPGYGTLWQPYFAGAGWDPFLDGAWAFNQGYGYGWVSAYPWGWTPYHYGTWVFLPGNGWAWQPGGAWTPVSTQFAVRNAPAGFTTPHAPTGGTGTVMVGRQTLSASGASKVVIRNNSAGLNVPRGGFENMGKLSARVEKQGVVTQRVSTASTVGFEPMHGQGMGGRGSGSVSQSRSMVSATSSLSSAGSGHSSGGAHR